MYIFNVNDFKWTLVSYYIYYPARTEDMLWLSVPVLRRSGGAE